MTQLSKYFIVAILLFLVGSCNQKKEETPLETTTADNPMEEKMLATTDSLFHAWNTGDASVLDNNMDVNYLRKSNGNLDTKTKEEYASLLKMFKTAMPDLTFTYEVMAVNDKQVFTKWTAKGTNTGEFGPQPPTGKSSVTNGFSIVTCNNEGKAIAEDVYFDQMSYLQDWGYTLTPPKIE